jgi:serine/threonine protein kinase
MLSARLQAIGGTRTSTSQDSQLCRLLTPSASRGDPSAPNNLNPDHREPMIGRRLGTYEIVEQIGAGGMGEVYRAIRADDQYRKQVAIKLVRAGQNSDFVIRRFKNERQILASLDHPNIAQPARRGHD